MQKIKKSFAAIPRNTGRLRVQKCWYSMKLLLKMKKINKFRRRIKISKC
jgi:hypothetical protein